MAGQRGYGKMKVKVTEGRAEKGSGIDRECGKT